MVGSRSRWFGKEVDLRKARKRPSSLGKEALLPKFVVN